LVKDKDRKKELEGSLSYLHTTFETKHIMLKKSFSSIDNKSFKSMASLASPPAVLENVIKCLMAIVGN
jgi:hypothetical protein